MSKKRIAIIGAGISGLTTAYLLQKAGKDVVIFEKNNRFGGSIVTEKEQGFLVDLGPNSTLETSTELRQLVEELGLAEQRVYANDLSNNRFIVRNGQLHPLPMKPPAFLKTKLFSWKAKFRLFKEPFIPKIQVEDISLADYVKYRLGDEFLDYAINPFVAGVYAGDPRRLSAPAAFPKLFNLEQKYGSFIKGAIKGAKERKKRSEVAKDRAKMFSFMEGMQVFPQALADRLQGKIQLGTAVTSVKKEENGFRLALEENGKGREEQFEEVVVCVPTHVQSQILDGIIDEEKTWLNEVPYPPVSVVFMGFRRSDVAHPLDGFGFLVPEVEKRNILGSIFSSTIFPNRAPENAVAFTTFVGGMRQPENARKNDEQLIEMVLKDLNDLVGLKGEPQYVKIGRWEKAIPQYELGYQRIQNLYNRLEEEVKGLFFAGNFRRGISIGDSVLSAHETVKKMLNISK